MGDLLVEEMGELVSRGILAKLKSAGLDTSNLDFNELTDRKVGGLSRPAVNISINEGTFTKVTLITWKQGIVVSVFILVQNLRNEQARRFAISKLLTQIVKVLLNEKLGLPLQDSLKPRTFNNVTDTKFQDAGYLIYQLNFSCSYNITKDEENDLGELETIVNHYFLQDPIDDGVEDIQGIVELFGVYGGDANSEYLLPGTYGGHAASDFDTIVVYGGNAGSTY